jgi:hypothetical protein
VHEVTKSIMCGYIASGIKFVHIPGTCHFISVETKQSVVYCR